MSYEVKLLCSVKILELRKNIHYDHKGFLKPLFLVGGGGGNLG